LAFHVPPSGSKAILQGGSLFRGQTILIKGGHMMNMIIHAA
jgi:hypothetical protein